MVKRAFFSWWFPFAVAACFVVAALVIPGEGVWLIGMALMVTAHNCIDLLFSEGGQQAPSKHEIDGS